MTFEVQTEVELAPLTTLGIGGPARYFVRAATEDALAGAVEYAREHNLPVFILGGGSNVLIADAGFDGMVIQIAISGSEFRVQSSESGSSEITVGAGEDWDAFVAWCVENDLAGVECLSGIPGTVGGTPVQNVGAYGQEVSETIVSVRCLDRTSGEFVMLTNAECGFTYRTSIFNSSHRDRYIVVSVTYALKRGGRPKIAYKDLLEHFAGREPTLSETRDSVLAIRRAKSMVIDATDPNSRSAGSFFKNPIVPVAKLDELRIENTNIPSFSVDDATVKIPAAWLIEHAGFQRGFAHGNAGISSKHTLALINRRGASAAEVIELKEMIQREVLQEFGIDLHPEPIFLGF